MWRFLRDFCVVCLTHTHTSPASVGGKPVEECVSVSVSVCVRELVRRRVCMLCGVCVCAIVEPLQPASDARIHTHLHSHASRTPWHTRVRHTHAHERVHFISRSPAFFNVGVDFSHDVP